MIINPNELSIKDFNYSLPEEKIAKYPTSERDKSKLLIYKNKEISQSNFHLIGNFLPSNSLLVFNNTKVIHARLHFKKATGANIEIFCLEPHWPSDYVQNFQSQNSCQWVCLVGNLKRWKTGNLSLTFLANGKEVNLTCKNLGKNKDENIIEFHWDNPDLHFSEIIEILGELPIPPYLNRSTEDIDLERYQTIYSKIKGSVAAPTAGLHFTPELIQNLSAQGFLFDEVTLHVGAGTFKPVKADYINDHDMHSELICVSKAFIAKLLDTKQKVIAVGTTSMRTLESLYWLGVKLLDNPTLTQQELIVNQWYPYQFSNLPTISEALEALINYLKFRNIVFLEAHTQIIIVPGYEFKLVDGLITNFHQPQSTLLLLVAAFAGSEWRSIYQYALENNFRFLSYGDSSYLER